MQVTPGPPDSSDCWPARVSSSSLPSLSSGTAKPIRTGSDTFLRIGRLETFIRSLLCEFRPLLLSSSLLFSFFSSSSLRLAAHSLSSSLSFVLSFKGPVDGEGSYSEFEAYDEIARVMAGNGKCFQQRAWRIEDMQVSSLSSPSLSLFLSCSSLERADPFPHSSTFRSRSPSDLHASSTARVR